MYDIVIQTEHLFAQTGLSGEMLTFVSRMALALLVLGAACVIYLLCHRFIVPLMVRIAEKTVVEWDDILLNEATLRAASHIIPGLFVWMFLPDVFAVYRSVPEILSRATAFYVVLMSMRLGIAFIDSFKGFEGERRTALQQYFHTFCGVLKIGVIFISVIVMLAVAIGRSPLTLLAGLGATSAILMLVFKDTITGLVAGVRLTSNDMLHKGDWITVPKTEVNGIVEDITLTTVKVRNFDNTILTVSPLTLVDGSFQNWMSMRNGGGRRVKRMVYFDFRSVRLADDHMKQRLAHKYGMRETEMKGEVVNMTLFRRYVERWIAGRDDVNSDMMFFVRQLEATSTGLPMEFYFFLKQKDWKPYEHHLAEIMEYIYAIVDDFGLKIYQRL
ncbi:mechanosensitive ion channel family protein [Prevotella sp. HCN-7019]|uniref:mechanosensitive ion channel family protein n=1 Tax=Prevotella sp. HCN-7019 TaxID=3134668 RepID=UPI0030BF54FB